jgi:hypothetical protein
MKIFLDTEFTDFIDPRLISIGLAASSGEEFYAEIPYPPELCSEFVKEIVIPLLGRNSGAVCTTDELSIRLIAWLNLIRSSNEKLDICFDFPTDWHLFSKALNDRVPEWCQPRLVGREINAMMRYDFHKRNHLPQHHALYDAKGIRYAFRERPPVSF